MARWVLTSLSSTRSSPRSDRFASVQAVINEETAAFVFECYAPSLHGEHSTAVSRRLSPAAMPSELRMKLSVGYCPVTVRVVEVHEWTPPLFDLV